MSLRIIISTVVAILPCGAGLSESQDPIRNQQESVATYNFASLGTFQLVAAGESRLLIARELPRSAEIISYDLKSGKATSLNNVNNSLRDDHVASLYDARIRVSGDAKTFAWARYPFGTGFHVVGLDGKLNRAIVGATPQDLAFEPGTSSLVVLGGHGIQPAVNLTLYDFDSGATATIDLPASPLAGTTNEVGHPFMPCFHVEHGDMAIVLEHYIFGPINPMKRLGSARYAILGEHILLKPHGAVRTFKFDLPRGSDLIRAFVAPKETQVLWELGFQHTTELWIGPMEGKGLRRLFSIPYTGVITSGSPEPPITDVSWLPNHRGVSWRVGTTVYLSLEK